MACHQGCVEEGQIFFQCERTWLASRDSRILEFHHISQMPTYIGERMLRIQYKLVGGDFCLPIGRVDGRTWEETSIGWFANIFDCVDLFVEIFCWWLITYGWNHWNGAQLIDQIGSL